MPLAWTPVTASDAINATLAEKQSLRMPMIDFLSEVVSVLPVFPKDSLDGTTGFEQSSGNERLVAGPSNHPIPFHCGDHHFGKVPGCFAHVSHSLGTRGAR